MESGSPSETSEYEGLREYEEKTVSTKDWLRDTFSDPGSRVKRYFVSLFPIAQWIYRYNFTWFLGDLIAGVTVGAVVVPQGMSYAQIATLPPEYGLYSSFIGVFIYCFFATSKDVTIGPVAVMSLEVAKVIQSTQASNPSLQGPVIATAVAFLCGAIALGIGLLRLGWIIEFIPAPAVAGFMTGSAFTIAAGQVPALMGISKLFNTRATTYLVVINTLKHLGSTTVDAAFGLVCLFVLYAIKIGSNTVGKRYPKLRRASFFTSVLRNAVVIIVATAISYGVCKNRTDDPPIRILGTVPRGFQHIGLLQIDSSLAGSIAPQLPVATIILVLEHIAISKSFGRINDYKIVPDQELIAIGVTNMVGTFFNAYPATGSFSRSAIKSKSGVRTPLAGIITGLVVLLALYALTGAFYYIPNAGLSAVIIHAVLDLIAHPRQVYNYWKVQPLEAFIFIGDVFITVFVSIEWGVYFAMIASLVLLLWRIALPEGRFLGRVQIGTGDGKRREVYVPLDRKNFNPSVKVEAPPPGVIIYRPSESFTYPNASRQNSAIVEEAYRATKRGRPNMYTSLGERPWNDPGPRKGYNQDAILNDSRPVLRAVILDFASVAHIDTTGIQNLVDTQRQLNKYADREVEFHFANILSPWIRRALLAGGFGTGRPHNHLVEIAATVPPPDALSVSATRDEELRQRSHGDLEIGPIEAGEDVSLTAPIVSTGTPFFHLDIPNLDLDEKLH